MPHLQNETSNISLRPALATDEALLFKLYASTRMEEFAGIPWSEAQLEAFLKMQFDIQNRNYQMQYPEADREIIVFDEQAIGRVMVNRGAGKLHLVDITLLPEFRRRGIGSFILEELQREAAREGQSFSLMVSHSNPARRLYERFGFTKVGESSMYFDMLWQPEI